MSKVIIKTHAVLRVNGQVSTWSFCSKHGFTCEEE